MKYDLKNEKIAVHCKTLEEAEKVVDKMLECGHEEKFKGRSVEWFKEEGERAYFIKEDNTIDAINPNFFAWHTNEIIPASEYLSQFEEVPKYGDKVWDENGGKWVVAGLINGYLCVFSDDEEKKAFEHGGVFGLLPLKNYRTTDPALDKKVLELTKEEAQKELAKLKGVEIKIKE